MGIKDQERVDNVLNRIIAGCRIKNPIVKNPSYKTQLVEHPSKLS